ncbi:3-carboxy-cis,cis-muconate cycloisomerase [Fodinicola acaciae]|uniref:3-carboxy-cis,cis-muconate cycloisomerase n=1 Tax=Fodinicola acaciae TaxID=2681555 RepID=UPI0013D38045|nr:3-carboxy-cis,cis-muconate cycloisomerase [Fodinicola acaciae]
MRPSSSSSDDGLFDGVLAAGGVAPAVSDRAWLRAMLDAEAALAQALSDTGLISAADADAIVSACDADEFDIGAIGAGAADSGNPVPALVKALTSAVRAPADRHVHRGATSQDILDTAAMLVTRRAMDPLLDDLSAAADACAGLADQHRDTLMAGRTLLQQALPTTFGLRAAGWTHGIDTAIDGLEAVRERLAVQLGGAAGTLASLGGDGVRVAAAMARRLDLAAPVLPWHTERTRIAVVGSALATAAGAVGKVARDITLLAQTEVGEVSESAGGGSSTLPHKQNPVAAIVAIGGATRAPGLASTLFAAMVQEHERAAGSWHAEWRTLTELLTVTGSAAHWLRVSVSGLRIHTDRMRSNVDITDGLLLAERLTTALTEKLGRQQAHQLVTEASRRSIHSGRSLADELEGAPMTKEQIDKLLTAEDYLGSAHEFIDRALAAHRRDK